MRKGLRFEVLVVRVFVSLGEQEGGKKKKKKKQKVLFATSMVYSGN